MIGLGEILAGMNILDRLGKFWTWIHKKNTPPAETITARFVRLFETHGVHRNQIPRFFEHGLTLKDVKDDAALLEKLDEGLLVAACALFAVRREWLDGSEKQAHFGHDFYKHPEEFMRFIDGLVAANPVGNLQGVLLAPEECQGHVEALIILQETIGHVGEMPIYRYHLCNNWSFTYWKARVYLTACIAIAWKRQIYIHGAIFPKKKIELIACGEELLGWQGRGIWFLGQRSWYPEDMALRPDAFLEGIDPERSNFGITSGLRLWLDFEEQGFMATGLPGEAEAKQLFLQELEKFRFQNN